MDDRESAPAEPEQVSAVVDRRRGPRRVPGGKRASVVVVTAHSVIGSDLGDRRRSDRRKNKPGIVELFYAILGDGLGQNENALLLAESIRSGLSPKVWSELQGIGYTTPELASVVGVSEKTISRKRGGRELMGIVEGDRTVRLAQITRHADRAFGDLQKALRWMRKSNRAMAGQKPIDLIATEPGAALVRQVLGTIEYGGVA
jgi:putative toxin-antitoxin system antitoxin component (TIGR02293 family)